MRQWSAMACTMIWVTVGVCLAQNLPPAAPALSAAPAPPATTDVDPETAPHASLRAPEPPVSGMVRADKQALAITLGEGAAARKLQLYDFEFDGASVPTDKLHLKQLSPGVLEITSVAYTVGEWRVRVKDNANYYGLGERSDTLNHAHTIVRSIMQDAAGAKGSSTRKPVPFFMSTSGYGMWFDTTGQATFDMNASSTEDIIVDEDAEKLRLVVFLGPELAKILDRFTALSGRATPPPYWALAPWIRGSEEDAKTLQDAEKARVLGLPASVMVLQLPSEAAAKQLHDQGYKMVVQQRPWMMPPGKDASTAQAARFDEAAAQGFFVKNADGSRYADASGRSFVDLTAVHARLWWQDAAREAIHAGTDGFVQQDTAAFPADAKFSDGLDARAMRNRYAGLEAQATGAVIEKDLKGNGVLLLWDATAGANALGLTSSSYEMSFSAENGLPAAVTAGISAGLSGIPLWVEGVVEGRSAADTKAFMRWSEFAAFSPVMLAESPWKYGDEALAVYRKYALLHMSLLPYRYAAAQEAAQTGMPIVRALPLAFEDDESARLATAEYLFGPDLLVAPVVDAGKQRVVYLPGGDWIDYWTGAKLSGPQTIVADAPMDTLPLYVRLGAVLPKLPDEVMTLVPATESGNKAIKAIDDRRVYEVTGPHAAVGDGSNDVSMTDFEGRRIVRSGDSLTIAGDHPAHIIVRWRFQKVQSATVDGAVVKLQSDAGLQFVEFDFTGKSTVTWR